MKAGSLLVATPQFVIGQVTRGGSRGQEVRGKEVMVYVMGAA